MSRASLGHRITVNGSRDLQNDSPAPRRPHRVGEWVAGPTTECNVCMTATSPPDPGVTCSAGHYTCRDCFCQDLRDGGACAPGGRADVEQTDPATEAVTKPKGSFVCLDPGCDCLLPELEVVKQINHDPAAYSLYTAMVGRHGVRGIRAR